ncbi:transcription antitermination factor NusB [Rhodobaculum claviforme]|uniref:Transcription antitermination protein NusB n=1 Tax=Rhodobaculum claviforme TaxID=1549854 RepID=A0A934TIZ5_9RHOB|nr:transcription antitermination factor NusB [Rhodobaculum claviforme]MBK5926529.1 transcription antitermination factor NusB [Rhodobaculum claviforme]
MTQPQHPPRSDARRDARRAARAAARLHAVQALFQMEAAAQGADAVIAEFEAHRIGIDYSSEHSAERLAEADIDLFRRLIGDAVDNQARIDQLTDRALVAKWPIARIDPTLRALFRAAGAELTGGATPPRVTITEFVEIARAFFPEGREPAFVNGVLDHMAREVHPSAFD